MASPSSIKRILVHVKRANSQFGLATFKDCLLEQLGVNKDDETLSCRVACRLEDNKLLLELVPKEENKNATYSKEAILKV